jgi:hypothetical protein
MGHGGVQGADDLAKPDQREKWSALVLIDTRKHRSAWSRAFRHAADKLRTGDAAEAKVTSSDIKGFTEEEVTFASAVATAPEANFASAVAPAPSLGGQPTSKPWLARRSRSTCRPGA